MCFELFLFKLPIINEFLDVLKIPFDVTNAVQNVSFSLSDFFGSWLTAQRRLNKLAESANQITDFARTLLLRMESRRSSLLNNKFMICAVYLDKRFSFKLSVDETEIAKFALEELYERVEMAKRQKTPQAPDPQHEPEDSFDEECVKSGLNRIFPSENRKSNCDKNGRSFTDLLDAFEAIDRQHNKSTLTAFWGENKNLHQELYELASIVNSIPPTQATVERSFSIFGYILNCRRSNLSQQILEDILMISLNRHFIDSINERDLQSLMMQKCAESED